MDYGLYTLYSMYILLFYKRIALGIAQNAAVNDLCFPSLMALLRLVIQLQPPRDGETEGQASST